MGRRRPVDTSFNNTWPADPHLPLGLQHQFWSTHVSPQHHAAVSRSSIMQHTRVSTHASAHTRQYRDGARTAHPNIRQRAEDVQCTKKTRVGGRGADVFRNVVVAVRGKAIGLMGQYI